MRFPGLLATCVFVLGVATGCGDDAAMSQDEVESYVEDALSQDDALGALQSVACEGGLEAKKGDRVICRVDGEDSGTDVTVSVSAVGGDELDLTLEYMTLDGLD